MYLIQQDPDRFKIVKVDDGHACSFHSMNPGEDHPNICLRRGACGCSTPRYKQVRRSREEIAEIRTEKRRKHEDQILAEAELIRASRRNRTEPN